MIGSLRIAGWDRVAALGAAAMAVVVLFTFQDYGITWDEHYHIANGKHVLAYFTSGFADRTALTWHNLYLYGGAFDLAAAALAAISPFTAYETSHLLNAFVGLFGIAGCWRLARLLGGPRAGALAALLLLLTPDWYGLMFNDPKDIPFAAAMIWTIYYFAVVVRTLPAPPTSALVKLGLALGATIGIRVGGVIVLLYGAVGLVVWLDRLRRDGPQGAWSAALAPIAFKVVLPVAAIGYGTMLAFWPWAQQDPILNPIRALLLFSHIQWNIDVLYEGRLVNSLHLPASYLAVYFLVKLPELVLAALAAGVVLALARWSGRLGSRPKRLDPAWAMLGMALIFPFAYFALARPVVYDAIRHFLFVLPPIAAAAGVALDRLFALAASSRPGLARLAAASCAAWVAWQGATLVHLHPNQYVYYNELAGGVKGAEDDFELDYWGNSYREAAERLAESVEDEIANGAPRRPYKVAVCSSGVSASAFFPPGLEWTGIAAEADFYIASTRLDCDAELDGQVLFAVERDGAVLTVVKDRRLLKVVAPERLEPTVPGTVRVHPGTIAATQTRGR